MALPSQPAWFGLAWLGFDNISKFRQTVLDSRCRIPETDKWRIPCLVKYLEERFIMKVENQDTSEVDAVILSLVTT